MIHLLFSFYKNINIILLMVTLQIVEKDFLIVMI